MHRPKITAADLRVLDNVSKRCAKCGRAGLLLLERKADGRGYELVCAGSCAPVTVTPPLRARDGPRRRGRPRAKSDLRFAIDLADARRRLGPDAPLTALREALGMTERTFRRYLRAAELRSAPHGADGLESARVEVDPLEDRS